MVIIETKIHPEIQFAVGQRVKVQEDRLEHIGTIEGIQIVLLRNSYLVGYFVEYTDKEGDKVTKIFSQDALTEI